MFSITKLKFRIFPQKRNENYWKLLSVSNNNLINNLFENKSLYKTKKYDIGFSDHTIGINASIKAINLGAKIIEKHFILDKSIGGPDADFGGTACHGWSRRRHPDRSDVQRHDRQRGAQPPWSTHRGTSRSERVQRPGRGPLPARRVGLRGCAAQRRQDQPGPERRRLAR